MVKESLEFLADSGITFYRRKGGGQVVLTDYWNSMYYIGLDKFSFRKAHTNKWVEKDMKVYYMEDEINLENYSGKIKDLVKNFGFMKYVESSRLILDKSCFKEDPYKSSKFIMPFGKYQKYSLESIYEHDHGYLIWLEHNLPKDNFVIHKINKFWETLHY
tara:strand:+ start:1127 stop:1606 length:480 start_codon:yes stop_codon:yes gene_type:complete